MDNRELIKVGEQWFASQGWKAFDFQRETWQAYLEGKHGMVNAPTGTGKTYALGIATLLEFIKQHPVNYPHKADNGLQVIWIAPIRALAKEIYLAMRRAIEGLGLQWEVGVRTGDTSHAERAQQRKRLPEFLITTPESLHVMLSSKGYAQLFKNLKVLVADEWHDLLGSKRAVQVELALSRLKTISPALRVWGISATIGNMDEAVAVLLGNSMVEQRYTIVRADIDKKIEVISVLPDEIETFPWAGHLGITLLPKIMPIIHQSQSTLIFLNTRSQAEIWYQRILEVDPSLAGIIAMHHGSINRDIRAWVEDALHEGKLKAVVCTASLDLGVDFRPVETIIQIGGPKGIARLMQRAGRSGHRPGAISRVYFVPTHSLELVESAAMRTAIQEGIIEKRLPYIRSFDVLVQYLLTLAVSDGFDAEKTYAEVLGCFSYNSLSREEWQWVLDFITTGGRSLYAYDEYKKVEIVDGMYKVTSRRIAMQHRLSIGTIVSDVNMTIKFMTGGTLGTIEEYFITRLQPGDVFWFAGKNLELIKVKGMQVLVRLAHGKAGKVPSWMGGRMPLSSQMSEVLRRKINEADTGTNQDIELVTIKPLIDKQKEQSIVPGLNDFLIEKMHSREGCHVFMYPFEGRFVHEGMASIIAYRIGLFRPITFTIALNDYGFELLSDQDIPIEEAIDSDIFTPEHLYDDIVASVNATEMARRKFRDIANIAGLVFRGWPGKLLAGKQLQVSSQLIFEVFREHEPQNLLFRQAFEEVMEFQLEENRMRDAFRRISQQNIVLTYPEKPTPFCFPILVDRLSNEKFSSEKLEDRVKKMKLLYEQPSSQVKGKGKNKSRTNPRF
ncbi:MAG: ligase-associated DNA damage response DEXH box helicase [Chitinophagales bacterium]|nr:ligase-associated DNA damage response DEXH box helicase [Chitinophagales bacterium]